MLPVSLCLYTSISSLLLPSLLSCLLPVPTSFHYLPRTASACSAPLAAVVYIHHGCNVTSMYMRTSQLRCIAAGIHPAWHDILPGFLMVL